MNNSNAPHEVRMRQVPGWATDKTRLEQMLAVVFPKGRQGRGGLDFDMDQYRRAQRWRRVIHLYYVAGYTRRRIAQAEIVSENVIRRLLASISRAARGLSANGKPRRKTGRPRKARGTQVSE